MNTLTKNILDGIISENKISTLTAINVIDKIRIIVKQYVVDNNMKSLVIGVSGGLDSAVVAAICQEKYIGVPLIGISIPMSSSNAHKEQAQWVGNTFCSVFQEFDAWDELIPKENNIAGLIYQPFYDNFFNRLEMTDKLAKDAGFEINKFPTNILQGNMKARIRMITLYDLARKTNGMVLSTDNLSEFQMGFWTICGDVGDYGPIQNISKGIELPIIADALEVRDDIISQQPSDGLMVTEDDTDEAQLGATYKYVDAIMIAYTDSDYYNYNQIKNDPIVEGIINRFNGTQYKRNGTINLTRKEIGI